MQKVEENKSELKVCPCCGGHIPSGTMIPLEALDDNFKLCDCKGGQNGFKLGNYRHDSSR